MDDLVLRGPMLTGRDSEAVELLIDEVNEETLRHLGSSELRDAIRGAKLRNAGDAYQWSRAAPAWT